MLIRFRVSNFRSIKDEVELSMVASPLSEHPENLVHVERYELDLLRCAAIYGPNASGKSTVVAALAFMASAVRESYRVWAPDAGVPRTPFLLASSHLNAPSTFVADLLVDDVRYEYGFEVDSVRVLREWLYAYPNNRRQEWFTRDVTRDEEFSFSRHLSGENRAIRSLTRANSLFLSTAAQNNHLRLLPIHRWFDLFAVVDERVRRGVAIAAAQFCVDDWLRPTLLEMLKTSDLGIVDMEVVDEDPERFWKHVDAHEVEAIRRSWGTRIPIVVRFHHRADDAAAPAVLAFEDESEGTKALFGLAALVVTKLGIGGGLAVDELDRSLHPHLATQIVRLFNDPATNPRNAQLIFNTHDTNLLDTSLLRRDQIWFTEKGDDGATRLFPLTNFRARKYENIERGYLQGRYGAVPSIRTPDALRKAAE